MDLVDEQKRWIEEWLTRFAWDLELNYLLSFSPVQEQGSRNMSMGYHLFLTCKSPLIGQELVLYRPFPSLIVGRQEWGDVIKKMVDELRATRSDLLNGKETGGA